MAMGQLWIKMSRNIGPQKTGLVSCEIQKGHGHLLDLFDLFFSCCSQWHLGCFMAKTL